MATLNSAATLPCHSNGVASTATRKARDQMDNRAKRPQVVVLTVGRIRYRLKLCIMLIAAGPMTAMNSVGRMQKISGMVIFTGTCWAFSSAS